MQNQTQSYLGNPNVKRDGVLQEWTPELLQEYKKCMENPVYFAQNYCKVISLDRGLIPFHPIQHNQIQHNLIINFFF